MIYVKQEERRSDGGGYLQNSVQTLITKKGEPERWPGLGQVPGAHVRGRPADDLHLTIITVLIQINLDLHASRSGFFFLNIKNFVMIIC